MDAEQELIHGAAWHGWARQGMARLGFWNTTNIPPVSCGALPQLLPGSRTTGPGDVFRGAIMAGDYHTNGDALTRSALATFVRNPQDYYLQYVARTVAPKQPTPAMEVGTLVHSILLDRVDFDDAVAVYPESCLKSDGSLNPKPAAQFRDDNADKMCLKEGKADEVRRAVNAVRLSALGAVLAGDFHFETVYYADMHGHRVKCKPDICGPNGAGVCVAYDLKVVDNDDDGLFHRNARRFMLWLQDAHYSSVLEAQYGMPVDFQFITVQVSPSYRLRKYSYDLLSRETARKKHEHALHRLSECMASDKWPDEYDPVLVLDPWQAGADIDGIIEGEGDGDI